MIYKLFNLIGYFSNFVLGIVFILKNFKSFLRKLILYRRTETLINKSCFCFFLFVLHPFCNVCTNTEEARLIWENSKIFFIGKDFVIKYISFNKTPALCQTSNFQNKILSLLVFSTDLRISSSANQQIKRISKSESANQQISNQRKNQESSHQRISESRISESAHL